MNEITELGLATETKELFGKLVQAMGDCAAHASQSGFVLFCLSGGHVCALCLVAGGLVSNGDVRARDGRKRSETDEE